MLVIYGWRNQRGCWSNFRICYNREKMPIWRQFLFWASRAGELGLLESDEQKSSEKLCRPLDGQGLDQGACISLLASEVASMFEQTSAWS